VHVFAWPFVELHLEGFAGKIAYAQLLNDASEIKIEQRPAWQSGFSDVDAAITTLRLPVQKPNVTVPVIELFLQ
jgi:alpha-L-fucosidase